MTTSFQLNHTRVLVTGAAGFIGSHLAEALVQAGARVRVFLRYTSTGFPGALLFVPPEIRQELEPVYGDLRDPEAVDRAVEGMDWVLHLGAVISIPYSYQNPREVVETNVLGTLNVLQAARRHGVQRVVQVSTSEVYGTARYTPMDEQHPRLAQSPYAASKTGADELARSFARSYGLPVVILRPFNTYGPRQSTRAVIMSTIVQALQGPEIRIGSPDPVRDFTFVADTVRGILLAAQREDVPLGEDLNLGTGQGIRIGDLVEKIRRLTESPYPVVTEQARLRPEESEVWQLVSDNSLARKHLGWHPQVTLDEGLQRTIAWAREALKSPEGRLWIAGSGSGWW